MQSAQGDRMADVKWEVEGLYFEACNCDAVCPCFSARPPTYGFCEGPCLWHVREGFYGDVSLAGLNAVMVQRTDGFMRETPWNCWFYLDQRANDGQFEGLRQIFTGAGGGHLGRIFGSLWQVQGVEPAVIDVELDGWRHRATILDKLRLTVGAPLLDAGPTLCRVPNVPGLAALADDNWFDDGKWQYDHRGKNALSTTFHYLSDP